MSRWNRFPRVKVLYAALAALLAFVEGHEVVQAEAAAVMDAVASSWSSLGSGGAAADAHTIEVPQMDSLIERLPIALNASGSFAVDNETITFESLFVPENSTANVTSMGSTAPEISNVTAKAESVSVKSVDVERIPIEKAAASETQQINATKTEIPRNTTLVAAALSFSNTTAISPSPSNSSSPSPSLSASPSLPVPISASSSSSSVGDAPAVGDGHTESPSPVVEIHGVPSPPTLVTAAAFDGRAEVSWNVPDDDGSDPILEYEVAWIDEIEGKVAGTKTVAHAPGSVVILDSTKASSQPNENELVPTTAAITSLVNGRSYTFKVRAKNTNGYSTWSAKSLAVSPLHPPDLCGRVTCSGHGTCFPSYQPEPSSDRRLSEAASSADGHCICRPGFNPPDCSVKNEQTAFVWKVAEWGECGSGCGGGQRTREAICWDVTLDKKAADATACKDKKPSLTRICNGMECGSKLVSVRYQVETSYDEVLFSPEAWDAFELAFTTEVAAALQIPRTRLEITAIRRGSIVVFFQILPASRVGERSLNDIVELLQSELGNATSTLRSHGTFARRVETTGVKLSFSIADQTVAGGAEDISIAGLIGTVLVLCSFVALFGWFLRKRHERITRHLATQAGLSGKTVLHATRSDMKPMGIRTMA